MSEPRAPLGIYIHWPYCARICPYCDFNVVRDRGRSEAGEVLVEAIAADLAAQAALAGPAELVSIYFGGGTPSLMRPEYVARLVEQARTLWRPTGSVEITLEANPNDADPARLQSVREAGVNRLSLGVQSFDDKALRFLKRDHDATQAGKAVEAALAVFPRVSIDLIYALPGQTPTAWAEALGRAAARGAEHVSAYQLTLEVGTPLTRAAARGLFTPADETLAAAFYEATAETLGAAGFEAYEVSNYARGEAARSRHNLVYWQGEAYVGAGPGAHGRLVLDGARTATEAATGVEDYIRLVQSRGPGWSAVTPLSEREAAEEAIMMGLRTRDGVARAAIEQLGRGDRLAELVAGGWLAKAGARVQATRAGWLVLDSLTGALLA